MISVFWVYVCVINVSGVVSVKYNVICCSMFGSCRCVLGISYVVSRLIVRFSVRMCSVCSYVLCSIGVCVLFCLSFGLKVSVIDMFIMNRKNGKIRLVGV